MRTKLLLILIVFTVLTQLCTVSAFAVSNGEKNKGSILQEQCTAWNAPPEGRGNRELPARDSTGKVHGELPRPQDLRNRSTEDLGHLLGDLRRSVQQRIRKNIELGSDPGHGQRQALEQDLIKSIERILSGR